MLHGMQRRLGLLALVLFGSFAECALAASVATSDNFTVLAPNQQLADKVVERAEVLRSRIGAVWLGVSPPATRTSGKTKLASLYVEIDPNQSYARTLVGTREGAHLVWLVGSEEAVTQHLLEHELAHVVLASRFGDAMPTWANEGIASQYDNARRQTIRRQKLAGFVAMDSWPRLEVLLTSEIRQPWQYATAVSLTDYLVARGGTEKFLDFVADSQSGLDAALATHYRLNSMEQLQTAWKRAVRKQVAGRQATPALSSARAAASTRYVR